MIITIKVSGPFDGPNFVNGLANQTGEYHVVNSTTAVLVFKGGIDNSVKYEEVLHGTGFGTTSDGRFTGTVSGFDAYVVGQPSTNWHVTGYTAPLNVFNTNASGHVPFPELLISPVTWKFIGAAYADNYAGGPFADVLIGHGGNDEFKGFSGNDTIRGGHGHDILEGNQGLDTIYGGRGADLIKGGADADVLHGGNGPDAIYGGAAGDSIFGGNGPDRLFGGAAADTIHGNAGIDIVKGGGGGDTIYGGQKGDTLYGGAGVDYLHGGAGKDLLHGGKSTDRLHGGKGNDVLAGGLGDDFIVGGKGNDVLWGNKTATVTPDHAFDSFIFAGRFGHDVITDFEINYDLVVFTGGIVPKDVSVTDVGNDVHIDVSIGNHGPQTIVVEGVAAKFDPHVDFLFLT